MLETTEGTETEPVVVRDAWLLDLGRMEYGRTWAIQKALVTRRAEDAVSDGLILVEHDPVVTLGRRGTDADVLTEGLPVFRVERGGEATFHGPGQLVGYPILKLPDRLDVKRLVTNLEDVLIGTCTDFGIDARHEGPERGVWVRTRKIASIGLAVQRGVTFHGFALNVTTDLSYFLKIRPCGHAGTIMTSMAKELGRNVDVEDVRASVIQHFQSVFGFTLRLVTMAELLPEGAPTPPGPGRP
ncbi:MAG TPA: lipoyl(octanoyl) transferase LipB [Thermoplasmata archaeon]|nr:lipoyl(octanoyl) transferase LipB [Thermoplasmata archaeon]